MTAKKMADIFFGNFSDLISKEKISRETDIKPEIEIQEVEKKSKTKKISKKIIIYVSAAILSGIAIYLVF